jgi:hypothetical protein
MPLEVVESKRADFFQRLLLSGRQWLRLLRLEDDNNPEQRRWGRLRKRHRDSARS